MLIVQGGVAAGKGLYTDGFVYCNGLPLNVDRWTETRNNREAPEIHASFFLLSLQQHLCLSSITSTQVASFQRTDGASRAD